MPCLLPNEARQSVTKTIRAVIDRIARERCRARGTCCRGASGRACSASTQQDPDRPDRVGELGSTDSESGRRRCPCRTLERIRGRASGGARRVALLLRRTHAVRRTGTRTWHDSGSHRACHRGTGIGGDARWRTGRRQRRVSRWRWPTTPRARASRYSSGTATSATSRFPTCPSRRSSKAASRRRRASTTTVGRSATMRPSSRRSRRVCGGSSPIFRSRGSCLRSSAVAICSRASRRRSRVRPAFVPSLYVVEDLHWADESTLSLLVHLAHRRRPAARRDHRDVPGGVRRGESGAPRDARRAHPDG